MEYILSPSFSHEKLENPRFEDLVDVFEDLWKKCFFDPIEALHGMPNGKVAAMSVLCSYYEAIICYKTGVSSKKRSKEFFVKGFKEVFYSKDGEVERAADLVYKHIRCGLAHEGMLNHKVNYSDSAKNAFYLTFRKLRGGALDFDAGAVSIVVNPGRMIYGTLKHFTDYVGELRRARDPELVAAFTSFVCDHWAIGAEANVIGVTADDF